LAAELSRQVAKETGADFAAGGPSRHFWVGFRIQKSRAFSIDGDRRRSTATDAGVPIGKRPPGAGCHCGIAHDTECEPANRPHCHEWRRAGEPQRLDERARECE